MRARSPLGLLLVLVACRAKALDYISPPAATDSRVDLGSLGSQVEAALQKNYRGQLGERRAPFSLVPSDGSELALLGVDATITIDGPLAHTELRFKYKNTEARTREGRFSIALPAGAAVGNFGMKVGDKWREARIVSREKGREVYETFLRRGIDPALLEQDLGEQFSVRVFPIFAHEDKELVVGYDHVVDEHRPYTLALAGLPAIPRLAIAIDRDGEVTKREARDVTPTDIVVPIAGGPTAVAHGGAFVARVTVPSSATTATESIASPGVPGRAATRSVAESIDRVLIAIDTSASRATVMGRQADALRRVLAELPADTVVAIAAFDHDVTELYRGPLRDATDVTRKLFDHGALGASDLGGLLARAAVSGMSRLVIIGDGVASVGEHDPVKLAAIVAGSPLVRVDAIKVGDALERDTLDAIVHAGKRPGAVLDGREPVRVAAQLRTAIEPELAIRVVGVEASVWPATTRGVAPGDPIYVFGLRDGTAPLAIEIGDTKHTVAVAGAAPHARRTVARAELAALTERAARATPVERGRIYTEIEKHALAHKLVSVRTSFIVFDNDNDEMSALGPVDPRAGATEPTVEIIEAAAFVDSGKFASRGGGGETVQISGSAPTIDPTSTAQGITIDRSYIRNIPVPGRSYEAAAGAAAGTVGDGIGLSIAGSSSLENTYIVDGIDTTPLGRAGRRAHAMLGGMGGGQGFSWVPRASSYVSEPDPPKPAQAYSGPLRDVMAAIASGKRDRALALATAWQLKSPGEIAAILALGEALEARGASALAARAYGSIADLYPNRAELLRGTAERLDRVAGARALAVDLYRRAVRERPDHVSTYRLLAYALLRDNQADAAFDILMQGASRARTESIPVLYQDARIIAAHLVARRPDRAAELRAKLGTPPASKPSMHFVLSWETDANDVDLHVRDRHGSHASYESPRLPSGGKLLHDLTDGYGPEMFVIDDPRAFPYSLAAHYYRKGAMGIGLGTVQIIRHDGHGNIAVEDRPFAIQNDDAMIDLGKVR